MPRLHTSKDPLIKAGIGYYYMDANSQAWLLGDQSLNETNQALYFTLQQVYKNHLSKDVAYVLYNDEEPSKVKSFSHGHTKGDICFDKKSGFWLVHSLPRYPPLSNSSYSYPHSGLIYGQTFMCLTYKYYQLNDIGRQLLFNYPHIYDHNLPQAFAADNPDLASAVQGHHVKSPPWNQMLKMTGVSGLKILSFAKFTKFDADLYDSWVAPFFQSRLLTETWQNGRGKMPSNCTAKYQVLNIQDLNMNEETAFKETEDHAKWALPVDVKGIPWMCIGDINRAEEQQFRSGGTVCVYLPKVASMFKSIITQVEKCSTNTGNEIDL